MPTYECDSLYTGNVDNVAYQVTEVVKQTVSPSGTGRGVYVIY